MWEGNWKNLTASQTEAKLCGLSNWENKMNAQLKPKLKAIANVKKMIMNGQKQIAEFEFYRNQCDGKYLLSADKYPHGIECPKKYNAALNFVAKNGGSLYGNWYDTGDKCVRIAVKKDLCIKMALMAVQVFTPFLKVHDDGYVWYGIQDHTIGENGTYKLKVDGNLVFGFQITKTYHGKETIIYTSLDLRNALTYIGKHYWSE